jgi:uncharacterized membrane protein (UPF0136 family)
MTIGGTVLSTGQVILWVYILLLILGGLMGFFKAGSKASLIASSIFAIVLMVFALGYLPFRYHLIVLAILLFFFGKRYLKSKKFMPSGLMVLLTIGALVGGYILR